MLLAVALLLSAEQEGVAYLREPIPAACIREVAAATGEVGDLLNDPVLRDAARAKARALSAATGRSARAAQELEDAYAALYRQTKDEFDNGIASQAELDAVTAQQPDDPVADIAGTLRTFRSCDLLAYFPDTAVSTAAKEKAARSPD